MLGQLSCLFFLSVNSEGGVRFLFSTVLSGMLGFQLLFVLRLGSITDSIGMSLSKLWETVKDREVWHAAVHEVTKSQT